MEALGGGGISEDSKELFSALVHHLMGLNIPPCPSVRKLDRKNSEICEMQTLVLLFCLASDVFPVEASVDGDTQLVGDRALPGGRACGGDLAAEAVEPSLALPVTASETLS